MLARSKALRLISLFIFGDLELLRYVFEQFNLIMIRSFGAIVFCVFVTPSHFAFQLGYLYGRYIRGTCATKKLRCEYHED
jgi:hypothetical protein